MKKTLVASAVALAMAAAPAFSAFAEAPQAGTGDGYFMGVKEVSVGEVDETVYSVDINWGDMIFDWKYDEATNSFNFQQRRGPGQAVSTMPDGYVWLNNEKDKGYIYEDESCKNAFDGEIVSDTTYYWCPIYSASGAVRLVDNSTNGRLKAVASFSSSDGYGWVTGRFGLWEMDTEGVLTFNESENGELQQYTDTNWDGSSTTYTMINLDLKKNREPSNSELISANDTIGFITLHIEPDTD